MDTPDPEPLDHTRLAAARLRAAELQPFLAVALYALTPRTGTRRAASEFLDALRSVV